MNSKKMFKTDKSKLIALLVLMFFTILSVSKFYPIDINKSNTDSKFKLFSFAINDSNEEAIKTAFFANDAYSKFLKLKENKTVLFASSASFVSSLNSDRDIPVGFCAEKGEILNNMPHQTMDGLVMIDNNHPEVQQLKIINLDVAVDCDESTCEVEVHFLHQNIRNNASDVFSFINTVKTNKASSFQTQLVYTNSISDLENFKITTNGNNDRSRRFLAICYKEDKLYHVIVDSLEEDYLMASAKNSLEYLRLSGYTVESMVNLDTGSKDIIHAYDGENLKNLRPEVLTSSAQIENASSLLVYYTEK